MQKVTPEREPGKAFPDTAVESYAQMRAEGCAPKLAAKAAGIEDRFAKLERAVDFQRRLQELRSGAAQADSRLALPWIVAELKRNVRGARSVGHYKPSNDALELLIGVYDKYRDQLEGDSGRAVLPEATADRRAFLRSQLSVVQGSGAANE